MTFYPLSLWIKVQIIQAKSTEGKSVIVERGKYKFRFRKISKDRREVEEKGREEE